MQRGETEDDILDEAFAVVREASWRVLGLRHYDVQMVGGMVLNDGRCAYTNDLACLFEARKPRSGPPFGADSVTDCSPASAARWACVCVCACVRVSVVLVVWGRLAEMATGEGKTLVASLPSYLNALRGAGVHVVTVLRRPGRPPDGPPPRQRSHCSSRPLPASDPSLPAPAGPAHPSDAPWCALVAEVRSCRRRRCWGRLEGVE